MTTNTSVGGYAPNQPVWIWSWHFRRWRPGIVLSASARAVLVRYQPTEQQGSAVDTVTPDMITNRTTTQQHHNGVAAPTGPDPPGSRPPSRPTVRPAGR